MNKDNKVPRSILLKMIAIDIAYRKKHKLRLLKIIFIFWILGFIAGYSLAMITETGDFWWYPGKNYEK
jgi:hypothetical protein